MNRISNLDQRAAQSAQAIIAKAQKEEGQLKRLDVFITKTLGVLQEQGVYACMLFLYSRTDTEKPKACIVRDQLLRLLKTLQDDYKIQWQNEQGESIPLPESAESDKSAQDVLNFYAHAVTMNLDILLLVRDLYEQALIYGRYGAKAAE